MNKKYALVQKGKIIKFRSVDDFDYILIPKLVAHNYLPVVETVQPKIDPLTQTLSDDYVVLKDKVERRWVITERTSEEIEILKKEKIRQDTIDQIEQVWDDNGWQEKVVATIEKKHADEASLKAEEVKL